MTNDKIVVDFVTLEVGPKRVSRLRLLLCCIMAIVTDLHSYLYMQIKC